jgi:hypothetical protein
LRIVSPSQSDHGFLKRPFCRRCATIKTGFWRDALGRSRGSMDAGASEAPVVLRYENHYGAHLV